MEGPAAERTDPRHPEGVTLSGVAALRRQFADRESAQAFLEWADHPVTKLVRRALSDMAMNGPAGAGSCESFAVQYGVTLGLGVAAQMLEDASLVVSGMFGSGRRAVSASDLNTPFSVSASEALDRM